MLLAVSKPAHAGLPVGIGVLGDSYTDEYEFYPPDRPTGRNWVEILARDPPAELRPALHARRGEPRNQGFAFNWARRDAATEDMIRTGQLTGLAAQVSRGEVQPGIPSSAATTSFTPWARSFPAAASTTSCAGRS